jgi:hypothetical protein
VRVFVPSAQQVNIKLGEDDKAVDSQESDIMMDFIKEFGNLTEVSSMTILHKVGNMIHSYQKRNANKSWIGCTW